MTLNDKIISYLTINNISYTNADYSTGFISGGSDQILSWNNTKLGSQPTESQLDSAYTTYQSTLQAAENKANAISILASTDWTTMADVTTGTHKLTNQADFIAYRDQIRIIAVNPTANVTWPTMPTEQWSS